MATEVEEKEAALKLVKDEATAAAKALFESKSAEFAELGLKSEASKTLIKALAQEVVDALTVKESDGKVTALNTVIDEMQKQHDALSAKVQNMGPTGKGEVGPVVKFIVKSIEDKAPEKSSFSAKLTIKALDFQNEFINKAPALMTTANVIPNVAGGFSPLFGNYIDTEIGHTPKPENIILPLITVKNQPGTENIYWTDRINEEGNAQFIAEGALKPLADAEWKTYDTKVKEVAVRWKMTKRLMFHAPSVVSDFREHAQELVDQVIDDQLLEADGTGNNLLGLQEAAAAFIVPPQLAGFYTFANIWDVIMAIAVRIKLSNFKGQQTAILNTVWEAKMAGYKTTFGQYIIPPFVSPDGKKVGSVNVVFSNKIDDDSILQGELKRFNAVFAENIMYDEGYENDDFSKNLVSRKLEAFLGTYIKGSAAGSIIFDSISAILEDIEAPTT